MTGSYEASLLNTKLPTLEKSFPFRTWLRLMSSSRRLIIAAAKNLTEPLTFSYFEFDPLHVTKSKKTVPRLAHLSRYRGKFLTGPTTTEAQPAYE
jgi:hypothetical protein